MLQGCEQLISSFLKIFLCQNFSLILFSASFWHFYPISHCFSSFFVCGLSHLWCWKSVPHSSMQCRETQMCSTSPKCCKLTDGEGKAILKVPADRLGQDRFKTLNLTTLKTRRSYLSVSFACSCLINASLFTFAGGVLTPDRNLSFLSKTLRQKQTHINTAFLFISLCCGHLFHLLQGMHYSS